MTIIRPGSVPISDTGLAVPRGVDMRLASLADSTGLQVPSSAWTIPAAVMQPPNGAAPVQMAPSVAPATKRKASAGGGDHQDKAGPGHNSKGAQMPKDESGNAPSWATPSKLSLDEAAKALIGPGRYAQERRALIEAIFDPRLGIAPLPLQLLAAVVECINGKTGMAHPGGRYWAQRIVNYLNGLPTQYREGALKNAVTAVRQAGYAVSEKRAAEKGGRAIAHFAITYPTPEEKQAGIDAYLQERQGLPPSVVTRRMTSAYGHSEDDLSCGHPGGDLRQGCGHPGTEAVVTLGVKKGAPLSITEPDSINPYTASSNEDAHATLPLEDKPAQQAGEEPRAKPTKKRAAPRTAIPSNWRPTPELVAWVKSKWAATDTQITREAEKFVNSHQAKGNLMASWSAAWRTWWGNEYHRIPRRPDAQSNGSAEADSGAALDAQLEQRRRAMREGRS